MALQTRGSPDDAKTVKILLHFGANPNATDNVSIYSLFDQ